MNFDRLIVEPDPKDFDASMFAEFSRKVDENIAKAFGLPPDLLGNVASDGAAPPALTANELLTKIREMEANVAKVPPRVQIHESWLMTGPGPRIRTYPRRRAKSDRHWRRMDKKWRKRYGYLQVPMAYQTANLFGRIVIFAHPVIVDEWRRSGQLGALS